MGACLMVSSSLRILGSCLSLSLWLVTSTSGCARMLCASCVLLPAHMSTRVSDSLALALCSGTIVYRRLAAEAVESPEAEACCIDIHASIWVQKRDMSAATGEEERGWGELGVG